ncbi:hypothetical protein LCGC14_2697910 [marine sediment metagenome]|uniref:Uncharacterized protein n=1 Tax=marine sediment metagenome TaxID=412755 RepID=A0A0F9C8H4_9ZZZZ
MIKRLEELLEEIRKEPRSDVYKLSAKQLEFFDLVEELRTDGDYNLWFHYTGRLNQVINSKYSKE